MKKYVVAILSFFENEIKQFKIEASDEYNAVKKGMIEICTDDESRQSEIDWQNSEDYPKTLEDLDYELANAEIVFSVTEVEKF